MSYTVEVFNDGVWAAWWINFYAASARNQEYNDFNDYLARYNARNVIKNGKELIVFETEADFLIFKLKFM